jgi:uncharacterized protein YbjT (DUF2867 family)
MSKNILVVGASGLVGSNILKHLENGDSKITLLLRRRLEDKGHLKQIITEFNNIDNLDEIQAVDEVYIAIGKKLSLVELLYLKKSKRKEFELVDFHYIRNIALFAKKLGAKSLGLISAVGANENSRNIYLSVKGKIEKEIISIGFEKIVIAQPGHLLGKRQEEDSKFLIYVFEKITNILGYAMFGALKKFRNIDASLVAKTLISKMGDDHRGIDFINFDDFKNP